MVAGAAGGAHVRAHTAHPSTARYVQLGERSTWGPIDRAAWQLLHPLSVTLTLPRTRKLMLKIYLNLNISITREYLNAFKF
jgi:hypothetical protein